MKNFVIKLFILLIHFLVGCNICTGGMMVQIMQDLDVIEGKVYVQ